MSSPPARALDIGDAAGVAAITAVVLLAGTPLMPALAARIARLPMPVLPLTAEDIRHATDVMPGRDVLARARAADRAFTSLTAASAVTLALCAGWIADDGSWYGTTLAAVVGIALWLRARHFTARRQRCWLLCAGTVCLGLAVRALGASDSVAVGVVVPVVLLLGAVVALVWGVRMAGDGSRRTGAGSVTCSKSSSCCQWCRWHSGWQVPTPRCRTSSADPPTDLVVQPAAVRSAPSADQCRGNDDRCGGRGGTHREAATGPRQRA